MRRRLLIGLLVAAVSFAAVSSAAANLARGTAESDMELIEGSGRVLVIMRGALIGSVASGRIEIRELPSAFDTDIQVLGDDSPLQVDETTTVYEGENLRFRVFRGKWRVDIRGTGIFTSIAGVGTVRLAGDQGRYSVEGAPFRPWPTEWTKIPVGSVP
jgi:hypothetical protein